MDERNNSTIFAMVLTGLFTALTAIFSQIIIPIGAVPINLALLAVFLCGGILGAKRGIISILIYILLGIVGVPVFAGFKGGFSTVVGPTGGFIVGYILIAFAVGITADKFGRGFLPMTISMVIGLLLCYALGTVWFMVIMKQGLIAALLCCVVPFILGDAAKIAASVLIIKAVGKTRLLDKLTVVKSK